MEDLKQENEIKYCDVTNDNLYALEKPLFYTVVYLRIIRVNLKNKSIKGKENNELDKCEDRWYSGIDGTVV
jgi:hypothetical protein